MIGLSDQPQQIVQQIEGLTFFSNFDSGNLSKVQKSSLNSYDLFISPDAAAKNFSTYTTWFYFGIKGMKKGTYLRMTIQNLNYSRPFSSHSYRPVFRSLPHQSEWQRILSEPVLEQSNPTQFKYSFTYESLSSDPEHFFAFAIPYPYAEIQKNLLFFNKICQNDCVFHKETIAKSLDNRDIALITISNKSNFSKEREERLPGLFPSFTPRSFKSAKPVIFITSRVHPGETPASFLLDGLFLSILANDSRGVALRKNFVFKIIPILNPDGVYRGNFRTDQNGVNLNRCYKDPTIEDFPSIFAVREYFLSQKNVKYYFDLHAHMSKRSNFLFGNFLADRQSENQIFAKLFELNCQHFEFSECDFSEKSMSAKDPKDNNTKEGSGRVALYNAAGIVHSYTIECSYYMPRPFHSIPQTVNLKTGKKFNESVYFNTSSLAPIFNRSFFNEIALGMLSAVLDLEGFNNISRIPLSEYRSLEYLKECLKGRTQIRALSKIAIKEEKKERTVLPKLPIRKTQKMTIVAPAFSTVPQFSQKREIQIRLR